MDQQDGQRPSERPAPPAVQTDGVRRGRGGAGALHALLPGALALAIPLGLGSAPLLLPAPLAQALELRGQTYFVSPPWKVTLRNYYWYVNQSGGEYYITIELPDKAAASLGAMRLQQTRGIDRTFRFDTGASRAFLGLPRREGAQVPVVVRFDNDRRLFHIDFPQPVPPGSTLTVALRPHRNPSQADSYMFQVTAFPAGPNPVASPVGFVTLSILQAVSF
ncbi:DUF2808 domain-containing protein [Cyanobium sp. Morenito 9A2]|uniref:DUF2808 domain-containing protein n=1 Tax=Cyanobium sp. Morenito 9A2 TaxID=2823718 RepID=UPI0020CD8F7B|nr:DUF2808 domain-containing protein [Cyanobium sp. Morenito 9A2]MCP9848583.1 DUF2808 domain-containing protein [Cyanobium sp. Morenito 9A2]